MKSSRSWKRKVVKDYVKAHVLKLEAAPAVVKEEKVVEKEKTIKNH